MKSRSAKALIAVREERGVRYLEFGPDYVQGAMRIRRPCALVLDYTKTMMAALLLCPQPKSALLIGLGAGSMAKFLYRYYPQTRITVVEIDARVVDVAREAFALPDDPARLKIVLEDGGEFLQRARSRFDLLFVDGFDHDARADRLETLAFYRSCFARISDAGVIAANLLTERRGFSATVNRLAQAAVAGTICLPTCDLGNAVVLAPGRKTHICTEQEIQWRSAALKALTGLNLSSIAGKLKPGRPGYRPASSFSQSSATRRSAGERSR